MNGITKRELAIAVDLSRVLPNVKTIFVGKDSKQTELEKCDRFVQVKPAIEKAPQCAYCSQKATHACDTCHLPMCAKHVTTEEPYDCCREHVQKVVAL